MKMERIVITEPVFMSLKPSEKGLIGIASVVFNNSLYLGSISVYTRPNGDLRLVFPNKILPTSKEINVYYPICRMTYDAIKNAIEDKYKEITANISG